MNSPSYDGLFGVLSAIILQSDICADGSSSGRADLYLYGKVLRIASEIGHE
jgi:hypothetical protein